VKESVGQEVDPVLGLDDLLLAGLLCKLRAHTLQHRNPRVTLLVHAVTKSHDDFFLL
jgi:hypothetical protein